MFALLGGQEPVIGPEALARKLGDKQSLRKLEDQQLEDKKSNICHQIS